MLCNLWKSRSTNACLLLLLPGATEVMILLVHAICCNSQIEFKEINSDCIEIPVMTNGESEHFQIIKIVKF